MERRATTSMFERRLARVGGGKRRYPDDESPASVARRATIDGVTVAGMLLGFLPLYVSAACLGMISEGGWWLVGLVIFGPVTLAIFVVSWFRCRRVNRYFVERFAGSLDRWFFRPGFDPASPLVEESRGTLSLSSVEAGNPETFAPDLLATLTLLERKRVALSYSARIVKVGQGKDRYPDDESATSVARRAILRGVSFTGWLVATPVMVGLGYANAGLFRDGTGGWVIANVVLVTLLLAVWVLFRRRLRRVEEFFADR